MADPKQAAQTTRTVSITDTNPSIGWGNAVEAAIDTRAAELEASERSEPYVPAAKKPLPKVKPSIGPTNFPAKKPVDVEPAELKVEEPVKEKPVEVKLKPIQPTDAPKPLPIDAWVSAGMRAALSSAQQRGSRITSPEEAVAAARKRIDDMAKTEGRTFDDYAADAKRRGISLTALVDDSAKQINERWALSQASTRQAGGMVRLPTPSGPTSVTFDVNAAEQGIKDKLYAEAKARGVDINTTQPKILTATELRTEATRKMSGETSGFMGNPATSEDKEVSKEGEVGAQTADLIITELFSDDSDGTIGRYVQSLQNNPGGYAEWISWRSDDLMKKRGIDASRPNFTEQQRSTREQAANEVFAMKTKGVWTAPIFVNRDLQPDTYFGALGPALEVIGYGNEVVNGKPIVVQRQESASAWLLNALDAPQYALVGAFEASGRPNKPGESTFDKYYSGVVESTAGRRDVFKAVTESEGFQARQVYNPDGSLAVDEKGEPLTAENWRPWVYGTVGIAASVLFPDAGDLLIFPTVAKIGKGISSISEARRATKGSEILTQIAASRTAAKASFEESLKLADEAAKTVDPVAKAEKVAAATEARHQSDALFEAASSHERRLFAEQEGLAKHLDETDGDAHKQMKTQASIDSANVLLARTIVDRAEALESVHPAMRKPMKSVQGTASNNIQVGRKDLYDTHSQLKRAEDSFRNAARLPDTQNAVLSFVSQPELARLKELLPEADFNEILAELPNAIQNPQQFVNFVATKRANIQYPTGIGATTPSGLAFRQKVMSDGANIARKARDINSHVAAVERRVYDAILNNSESRAVAADTLANVLREKGPRNIPSIDNVPDLGDPTLKLAEGDVDAKMVLTDGAKKLVDQLRSAGLTKKQSIALAAMMDTRARAWAWKTGEKVEDWYKVGNADRVSFVKEQAANIPTLQVGTADFLFEGGKGAASSRRLKLEAELSTVSKRLRALEKETKELNGVNFVDETFKYLPAKKRTEIKDILREAFERDRDDLFRNLDPNAQDAVSSYFESEPVRTASKRRDQVAVELKQVRERHEAITKSLRFVDTPGLIVNDAKLAALGKTPNITQVENWLRDEADAVTTRVIDRIAPAIQDVNFNIDEMSANFAGQYSSSTHTIRVNLASAKRKTVLHEMVHAATVRTIETNAQSAEVARVDQLFAFARKQAIASPGTAHYGLTNTYEFIAEAFSNVEFQQWLKTIPVDGSISKAKTVWSEFVKSIVELLGINKGVSQSLLDETLQAIDDLISLSPNDARINYKRQDTVTAADELRIAAASGREFRENFIKLPVDKPMSLTDALKDIAKNDKREAFRLVAQRLTESSLMRSSTVTVINRKFVGIEEELLKQISEGVPSAGLANVDEIEKLLKESNGAVDYASNVEGRAYFAGPKMGTVEIFLPNVKDVADAPSLVVMHEAVHIATVRYISPLLTMSAREAAKLPADVAQSVDRMKDIFNQTKKLLSESGNMVALRQYGFTDVKEFVAEALSNPQFQDILKKVKVTGAEKSVWSYFVETVSNLLGINRGLSGNALVETISTFDRILTATSGPSFIKAAGATESIDKMENELIRLKRIVAQDPKQGIVYGDEIRQLEKSVAYSKREAAKAAKAPTVETPVPAPVAAPIASIDEVKSALSEAIKAEDAAKVAYEDALIAKRANPKDAAAKSAVEDAKAKLREASTARMAAKKAANAEIRAANKASQAEMLEDPDLKQAYARVRAAEKNVVDTQNNLERAKLAYADAVRAKDSVAKRAAERDITTLEAALGVFEDSERKTKDVYKRLADEYKAKKAAEAVAQDAAEEAKTVDNLDDKTSVGPIDTKPAENGGGLPVSVGPSSNIEEELLDLDQTGTATQVATGSGWPTTPPNAGTKAPTGAPTGAVTPPTPPRVLNPTTPAPTAATGAPPAIPPAPPVTPPPTPPGAPVLPPNPANLPKGAVAFYNDGRAIIYAFEKADFNTFVHEIGHVVRRDLIDEEREVMRSWLSVEAGKPVEIDMLGNFVDPSTGQLFSKADSDALEELFTDRFVDWMATSAKPSIKAASKPIDNVFEAVKSWMLDAYKTLKAALPNAVSAPIDEFFTNTMFIGKDPAAVSEAFGAAKRVVAEKRGFLRGMIGPDVDSVELYVFDELAKGAKAGGLNVTPAALEKMVEKNGYIEFPRPVLGRTRYEAREIATLQKELEEMGTTELYRSAAKLVAGDKAKSITEESVTDKLWNMLRAEPLNYDTIADPTKAINPITAFSKAVFRAITAVYIGLDEMADLRHLPPAVRQTVLAGVRVISSVYHDALKLAEERDLPKLFSYLTGNNVKFHNGRRVMTASWDSVSSVQMRLKDIFEAGGASIGADIQVLIRAADFSNMAPQQAEAAGRAVEFILNNTPSMFTKQLLQVVGASQPMNKVYDAVNTPKEMILAKALYNFAHAAPTTGIERFHGVVSKLYGESNGVKSLVLMAAHGQADRVRRTWFNAGIAISSTDANLFKTWLNGEYIPDSALPTIKRVADTLGLNPTFVPALDAIGKYDVPAAAYDRLTSALAKANPEKQHWLMKGENDTAGSSGPMAALQAWVRWRKTSMVRGSLLVRSRLLTSNSMDLILMAGNGLGLGVAMAASGRVAAQTALALAPGVTRAIDIASRMGWAKPGALEAVRDAIQASGDKFAGHIAKMMWNKAMSLDVNRLLDGEKTVFNMGGKVYSWEDLRQIALEEGVFDSMPASLESAVRRSVRAPVTATEKAGDKLASAMEYVSDVQEGVAERERAGMMLTLMELGVNPRVAARMTVKTMFDYVTSVASAERGMIISLFEPFWPFIKNSSRSLINNFFTGYGAYRIGLLRRATERSVDAINELIYDSIVDPYGVDVSALSDEGSDNYFEMRRIIEAKYGGVEHVPLNVKLSIGAVFAGQTSYFLHDGKLFYMKSRIGEISAGTNNNNKLSPYLDRLGLPARLDTEDAVIPRPDRSSSSSFYRDLYAITLPVTMTKQTQRYMEMAAPDHPFIEFLMPETYIQTDVRRMGSITALAVLGAYGLYDATTGFFNGSGPTTGEMEGLNWTRAGNITEQILDPERAMLLPQAYSLLFDDDHSQPYRIHPIMAKALSTIGVSHLEVNAAQDPFAVTFDTSQPTSKEAVASAEAISKNLLPGETDEKLGAAVKTTRHYLPAHWGLIIQSLPDLDGLNRELLRYNDAVDLKPGSGPMERSAESLYPIMASAFRVITGLSTAEPHRSKTALREEPRKDTTTTNPNK